MDSTFFLITNLLLQQSFSFHLLLLLLFINLILFINLFIFYYFFCGTSEERLYTRTPLILSKLHCFRESPFLKGICLCMYCIDVFQCNLKLPYKCL